jgi:FixJ family two-component response regulator
MVEPSKVTELKESGANDFLQKPFTTDTLLERVCDLIEIERPTG